MPRFAYPPPHHFLVIDPVYLKLLSSGLRLLETDLSVLF
jgi:hypothetical protein